MQQTVDYTNNKVSPATVEMLIRERNKGKSLRQLGQMFNRSGERVRKILAKYGPPQVAFLSEKRAAAKLGYTLWWIAQLREKGLVNPIRPGSFWLYSEEQVRQIPSLIAEVRKCQRCGRPRPPGSEPKSEGKAERKVPGVETAGNCWGHKLGRIVKFKRKEAL